MMSAMESENWIQRLLSMGRYQLTEYESKQLLAAYGIPVVQEIISDTPEKAVEASESIGYPVVLKASGRTLLHKSEKGLIKLNLSSKDQVLKAAEELKTSAGDAIEGFLVQAQIKGNRELVIGLFRDPLFGPAVMFGLGGVFTEVLSDVTFRLAPVSRSDAEEMVDEIHAKKIMGHVRGQQPVHRESLIAAILGLSNLAMTFSSVKEVDINPLVVTPDGTLIAVDALISIEEPVCKPLEDHRVPPEAIGRLFYPKSIAFIGASSTLGKWGHMLLVNTIDHGFKGDIHLVSAKGGTIAGRKVYQQISEIPGPVDLAIVTIPAASVIDLIPQLSEKKISNVLLITSGFSEIGEEGLNLQNELVEKARAAGILMLGPNTMGICNPHIHLYCTGAPVVPMPGSTAVVAQSGNMGSQLLAFAEQQGIGIRGFAGSGNEAMITIEDYLEGFENDQPTRTVMLYIESVKDGRRFFDAAKRVSKKKPVVVLKGGRSRAGAKAAQSHTGALSSDTRMFDAMCRQAGIVQVEHSMDLLDLAAAFSSLPLPKGNRVAIMTLGGGWGVVTADLCSENALALPQLSDEVFRQIDPLLPPYWSHANPVDIVGERNPDLPIRIMEALLKWDGCDGVINLGIMGRRITFNRIGTATAHVDPNYSKPFIDEAIQMARDFEKMYIERIVELMETYEKPIFGVSLMTDHEDKTVCRVPNAKYKAVFYETPERAVKAFSKMVDYQRFRQRL
jgi:acyl-CoA synthetase (NDP forming)